MLAAARHAVTPSSPESTASRAETALRNELAQVALQAAISAIGVLHTNLGSASRLPSSIAVFVTISAATIIAAASLISDFNIDLDDVNGSYGESIRKALQVLDQQWWQVDGASRASKQLQSVINIVTKAKNRTYTGMEPETSSFAFILSHFY